MNSDALNNKKCKTGISKKTANIVTKSALKKYLEMGAEKICSSTKVSNKYFENQLPLHHDQTLYHVPMV